MLSNEDLSQDLVDKLAIAVSFLFTQMYINAAELSDAKPIPINNLSDEKKLAIASSMNDHKTE